MTMQTTYDLFHALRTIITNIPEQGVLALSITLGGSEPPTMEIRSLVFGGDGKPVISSDGPPEEVTKRFKIVAEDAL